MSPAAASARARASSSASGSSSKSDHRGRAERQTRGTAGGDDEPGPRAGLGEFRQHELRSVVQPVRVLDHEQRWHQQHAGQELVEDVVQAIAPERRLDLVDLGSVRDVGIERQREQRQPLGEVGHHGLCERRQLGAGALARLVRESADQRPEHRPERPEGRRRRIGLAVRTEDLEPDGARDHLLHES